MPTNRSTSTGKTVAKASPRTAANRADRRAAAKPRKPKPAGQVKAFDFIVSSRDDEIVDDIPFTLGETDDDGDPIYYYVRGDAKEDALGTISAQFIQAEETDDLKGQAVGMLEMLANLFTEESAYRLLARIKNPRDKFGYDQLGEIIEWAIEQATDRPTTPSRT